MGSKLKGKPKSPEHRIKMSEAAKAYWKNIPEDHIRRRLLIEQNRSTESCKRSSKIQNRRWEKYHQDHPKVDKVLLTKEEISKIRTESHTGLKYKTRKDKGIKQGPRNTQVTCHICGRTMSVISQPHLKNHGMTREEYNALCVQSHDQ